jgi:hypothetical protein
VPKAVKDLIPKMSGANPGWGSPRIVGELAKLGIHVAKATAEKYMIRPKKPPSPSWRAFLDNHVKDLVSVDFFVVPTVTFRVLFVFVVLVHARRLIVHFNVTEHPTAQWTAQQLSEAFPWETAPRYLIRDRDCVYGMAFKAQPSGPARRAERASSRAFRLGSGPPAARSTSSTLARGPGRPSPQGLRDGQELDSSRQGGFFGLDAHQLPIV